MDITYPHRLIASVLGVSLAAAPLAAAEAPPPSSTTDATVVTAASPTPAAADTSNVDDRSFAAKASRRARTATAPAVAVTVRKPAGAGNRGSAPAGPPPATTSPARRPRPGPAHRSRPPTSPPVVAAPAPGAGSGTSADALAFALGQVGGRYRFGGTGSGGYDCSGLVQAAYARAGIVLPRTTGGQIRSGTPVSRKDLRPGDLVFPSGTSHVAIYVGNGQIVHAANRRSGIKVAPMYGFSTARRLT